MNTVTFHCPLLSSSFAAQSVGEDYEDNQVAVYSCYQVWLDVWPKLSNIYKLSRAPELVAMDTAEFRGPHWAAALQPNL